MSNDERWMAAVGHPGYEVSDLGRVRNSQGKVLRHWIICSTGYQQIELAGKREAVHRLVAMAFCDGFSADLVVNHKDGQKQNNCASNLEWVTRSENGKHAYRELGVRANCLGKFGGDHPTSKAVESVDLTTGATKQYASAMDAVRDGFDSGAISRCCNGRSRSHMGRRWRFVGEQREAA